MSIRGRWIAGAIALMLAAGVAGASVAPPAAAPAASASTPSLDTVPGLERVRLERDGSRIVLRGDVAKESDRQLARHLARAYFPATSIENRLAVADGMGARVKSGLMVSLQRLWHLLGMLPLLLLALLVTATFWWAGGWIARRRVVAARLAEKPFLAELLAQSLRLAVTIVGLLIGLEMLGATSLAVGLLGSAGVLGIALGFAFRDLLENYIASILLSLRQPFSPDDVVAIDGHEGVVVGMNSRATVLMTAEGNHLRLPNAQVFKSVTLNYTRNGKRRFDFALLLAPSTDVSAAMEAVLAGVRAAPGVLDEPGPWAEFVAADRAGVELKVFGWVDQHGHSYAAARSEALRRAHAALRREGFDVGPETHRIVHAEGPAGATPVPPAGVRPELPSKDCTAVDEAVQRTRVEMAGTDLLRRGGTLE